MKYIKLNSVDSTNSYASDLISKEIITDETCIYTLFQNKGRGLGQNIWESEKEQNLLFSIVFFPNIKIEDHFNLNMIVSLSICRYLNLRDVTASIKWPNDIYVFDKKIAGILIENTFVGDLIQTTIVGVGLNMNQAVFSKDIPNPVSLKNITGMEYAIDDEIKIIAEEISKSIETMRGLNFEEIKHDYLDYLYRYNVESLFESNGNEFAATIVDVKKDGYLVLNQLGDIKEFYFKEVSLVI
jgi:BirA family biotin operon repressor/biotin-[acetyl-CoA-carboxylase] ligase